MKMIRKAAVLTALLAVAGVSQVAMAQSVSFASTSPQIVTKQQTFISNAKPGSSSRVTSSTRGNSRITLMPVVAKVALGIPLTNIPKQPATTIGIASQFIRR